MSEQESDTAARAPSGLHNLLQGGSSREKGLDYIRQMTIELRQVADGIGEGTLVYYLEMAALEADDRLRFAQMPSVDDL